MAKQPIINPNLFARTEAKPEIAPTQPESEPRPEELISVSCRLTRSQVDTLAGYARDKGVPLGYLIEFFVSEWLRWLDNQERELPDEIVPYGRRRKRRVNR